MKLKSQSSSDSRRSAAGAPLGDLSPGDVIAGKYRLDRVVGRGGMGSVWAARNEQLGMLVALKFIEVEGGADQAGKGGADIADARARFEREAKAAAQIRSPHVAQVFEHGLDGDRPYIAMELLEGEDLGDRLRREGRLSVQAAARILTQASKALRRAHEAGIIHRDLKPGNIFLARFDDDEIVKILDFGVAKMRSEGALEAPLATQTGIVFGSPSYMSPEQARGVRAIDHRSDLWSMAVIVFRAITGVKPFQAASIGDLVVKLCIDPLPVATAFAPDLGPEVDRFFERAFARDPDRRFATAQEMATAFEAVAAGAAPPSIRAPVPSTPLLTQARVAAQDLPPAPPIAPPPAPGSGPHVAFAPGTLTPPPGTAVDVAPSAAAWAPPPPAPSYDAGQDATAVRAVPPPKPSSPELPPPVIAAELAIPAPPSAPLAAPRSETLRPRASNARPLALVAVLGVAALGLLVAVIAVASRAGGERARLASAPASAEPTAVASIAPPTAPPSAEPSASAALPEPAASAVPAASSAEPSAPPSAEPAASAEPPDQASAAPDPSAAPRVRTKPGKRRPNFGY